MGWISISREKKAHWKLTEIKKGQEALTTAVLIWAVVATCAAVMQRRVRLVYSDWLDSETQFSDDLWKELLRGRGKDKEQEESNGLEIISK